MARKSRYARRSLTQRRRSHRSGSPFVKLALACTALTAVIGTAGYMAIQETNYVKADANGCFPGVASRAQTVAIVDSSEPRFDEAQTRDLNQVFNKLIKSELRFQERVSIITTEERSIGSVPKPVLTFCHQAKNAEELTAVGAALVTTAYLQRQAKKFSADTYQPVLNRVLGQIADANHRQTRESPILEQVQSLSQLSDFGNNPEHRRLILVSDLIQATEEAQFCVKKGHLPRFEKFKATPYYQRIKPHSLSGVEVQIYMLIRNGYGKKPLRYCSEDELQKFWTAYFKEAGAASVDIIRLRTGRNHGE
ncbi:MAG: hypothetical protein ABJO52_20900 [Nisaea sp.]|uniref:hypothetical protein n=1 Tax=Nisaea sp. TaxID=2024842 RepID=UPI003298F439